MAAQSLGRASQCDATFMSVHTPFLQPHRALPDQAVKVHHFLSVLHFPAR